MLSYDVEEEIKDVVWEYEPDISMVPHQPANEITMNPRSPKAINASMPPLSPVAIFQPHSPITRFGREKQSSFDLSMPIKQRPKQRNMVNMMSSLPVTKSPFRHKVMIVNDTAAQFKYQTKDNRRIQLVAVSRVFEKTGSFIFNLGLVNCLESVIVNLFLMIYAYDREESLQMTNQRLPFLDQYQYTLLLFAYYMGSFVSLSSVQSLTLEYPWLPTFFQTINLALWCVNIQYRLVESYNLVWVWTVWVGVHSGTSYTNFLFLANTKTNLPCDMRLNYYERELVVNLLLLANDFG